MRTLRIALVLPVVPALAVAAACGGSASSNSPADSGAPFQDAAVVADAGPIVDAAHDGGATTHDSGATTHDAAPSDGGACPVVAATAAGPHAKPPAVINSGGPVLHSPQIVTFTFQDTANVAALQTFGATFGSTAYFGQALKDYTTTSATPAGLSVAIAANADATYTDHGGVGLAGDSGADGTDLNGFINTAIANAVAAKTIPAPDGNAVYVFYFPSTSTINLFGSPSCQGFGGYHFNQVYSDGTTPISYAILPDCYPGTQYELDAVTLDASHEIMESISDPEPNSGWCIDITPYPDAGTSLEQYRDDPWLSLGYGEIADNCAGEPWSLDGGTTVQRIWSISSAAGDHDPCVPIPAGEVYFNATPDKAIYVANVGDSFTIDVTPFSEAPRSSWQLDAIDVTQGMEAQQTGNQNAPPYLEFEWVGGSTRSDGVSSLTCVNNGSHPQLKVTLLQAPVVLTTPEGDPQSWPQVVGSIYSVDESEQTPTIPGQDTNAFGWAFEVVTPATAAMIGAGSTGITDMARMRRVSHPVRNRLPVAGLR
jgi:hypothetical protein